MYYCLFSKYYFQLNMLNKPQILYYLLGVNDDASETFDYVNCYYVVTNLLRL